MTTTLPGVSIITRDSSTPPTAVTDTGQAFIVGFAARGPIDRAVKVRNMNDFVAAFGGRVAYSYLFDALQTFFAEGGTVAYVSRVVGPTPVKATVNIYDQSGSVAPGDVALVATALEHGDYYNDLDVVIDYDAGNFSVSVVDAAGTVLETSGMVADRAAAVAWATATSDYIALSLGASNEDPRDGTYPLAGGADDHGNATDATRLSALNRFPKSMGPGQVLAPGITTTAAHTQLLDHAVARNRVALLDAPDSGTIATVKAAGTALRGYNPTGAGEERYGKLLGPWAVIPGLTAGTTRDVPYSAVEAGIIARNDGAGLAPNDNAAGVTNGRARYAVSLKHGPETAGTQWTDAERAELYGAGVNVAILKYGSVVGYGLRTLVDPNGSDSTWVNFGNLRELMLIRANADAIGERYLFRTIDGRGYLFSALRGELAAMLHDEWARNALFGDEPADAFAVDVSGAVNTPETIAARQIRALVAVRIGEAGEEVIIELVKVPVDQAVA